MAKAVEAGRTDSSDDSDSDIAVAEASFATTDSVVDAETVESDTDVADSAALRNKRKRIANVVMVVIGWYLCILVLTSTSIELGIPKAPGESPEPRIPRGVSAFSHLSGKGGLQSVGVPGGFSVVAAARSTSPFNTAALRLMEDTYNTSDPDMWAERTASVISAFRHAWNGYRTFAFGYDVLKPQARKGVDEEYSLGLTILDTLDTAFLMGELDTYMDCRQWVVENFSFKLVNRAEGKPVNVFETTIRALGGLLSTYALTGDNLFREKAVEIGDRLMGAFDTASGVPLSSVDLRTATGVASAHDNGAASTAEVGTLQLEFRYLSHITGQSLYHEAVDRALERVERQATDGLVPIFIDPVSGRFQSKHIRLGSRGDSYYEYLLKQYLQTNQTEPQFKRMYRDAVRGIKRHLVGKSYPNKLTFVGELREGLGKGLWPKMDHLVCFLPGTLALGATGGHRMVDVLSSMTDEEHDDIRLARELMETCYQTYAETATGLGPEITFFNTEHNQQEILKLAIEGNALLFSDFCIHKNDKHSLLRPETVESLFVLYRLTGDNIYREYAWDIFTAIETHAKVPTGGYTSLSDVTDLDRLPTKRMDKMESFFVAETLKYLFLIFHDQELVPLDEWVFNTEAHPLPVLGSLMNSEVPLPQHRAKQRDEARDSDEDHATHTEL